MESANLLDNFRVHLAKKAMSNLTIQCYCGDIAAFCEKQSRLDQVTPQDMQQYIDSLKGKVQPTTINRKISSIRTFYKWASKEYNIQDPTIHTQHETIPRTCQRYVSKEDIEKIFACISAHDRWMELRDRAMYSLILQSGVRVGEVNIVTLKDFNFDRNELIIYSPHRILPVSQYTKATIQDYIRCYWSTTGKEIKINTPLFLNHKGQSLSSRTIRRKLAHYSKLAGIPITPKNLRATFAVNKIQDGCTFSEIHALLGNMNLRTTQAYDEAIPIKSSV